MSRSLRLPRPVLLLGLLGATACGSSTPTPLGTEGVACYAPEPDSSPDFAQGRCNLGLACVDGICRSSSGGGEIVDSRSEAPSDAAVTSDAKDGGAEAATDVGHADGGSDAPTEGGATDASTETSADATASEVAAPLDGGDAAESGGDA